MRLIMTGLTEWMKLHDEPSDTARAVDTALTVVGTLLVAATWALLQGRH